MNTDALHKKLIAAAKANRPSDAVPFGFETRVMARIREQPAADFASFLMTSFWRAVAPCTALMLVFGVATLFSGAPTSETTAIDLETTVYAVVDLSD